MFVHGAVRAVARLVVMPAVARLVVMPAVARLVVMPADTMRRIKKTTKCNSLLLLTNAEA